MNVRHGFSVEPKHATPKLFNQVHGNRILHLSSIPARVEDADGAFTFEAGLRLHAFSADCIPVIFYTDDPKGPVGVVHSGWRGTMKRISAVMVEALAGWKLKAAIGPAIRECCFEVKEDFVRAFHEAKNPIDDYLDRRGGKIYARLTDFLVDTQLEGVAVDRRQNLCTFCSPEKFPSYRRNGGTDPHIKAWVEKDAANP